MPTVVFTVREVLEDVDIVGICVVLSLVAFAWVRRVFDAH